MGKAIEEDPQDQRSGRGILYVIWPGEFGSDKSLERSMASVKQHHPELPIHVERLPEGATLLDKSRMYDFTPFNETLYLDADTVVMGRLDYGFERADYNIACCICECPYARRFTGLSGMGDMTEYNTGVIFFHRAAKGFFKHWRLTASSVDSKLPFVSTKGVEVMQCNDQASFALAIHQYRANPAVLPMNWNFRPKWHKSWFGPIKIWHDYDNPAEGVYRWNESQLKEGAIIQGASSDWKFSAPVRAA